MVFCCIRAFFERRRKSAAAVVRTFFMQYFWSDHSGSRNHGQQKHKKDPDSVSSVFDTGRALDRIIIEENRLPASFTIEASLVCAILFFTLAAVIKQGYRGHDSVISAMVLEEMIEKARYDADAEENLSQYEAEGIQKGNTGTLLGEYRVRLLMDGSRIKGDAAAGTWGSQIEMSVFNPGTFLREYEALQSMKDVLVSNENGI